MDLKKIHLEIESFKNKSVSAVVIFEFKVMEKKKERQPSTC